MVPHLLILVLRLKDPKHDRVFGSEWISFFIQASWCYYIKIIYGIYLNLQPCTGNVFSIWVNFFSKGRTIIYNQINNLYFLYFLPLFHGPNDRVSRHKSRQTLIYSNILWYIFHMLWCLCNIWWCIVNILLCNIFKSVFM